MFPLSAIVLMLLLIYLAKTFLAVGRGWTKEPGIAMGCALAWVFGAETVRSGCIWYILRAANAGRKLSDGMQMTFNALMMLAGIVIVCALLRCAYIFTPDRLGHRTWSFALAVTVIFVSISFLTR